jgi:hypothetical protein
MMTLGQQTPYQRRQRRRQRFLNPKLTLSTFLRQFSTFFRFSDRLLAKFSATFEPEIAPDFEEHF